MSGFPFPAQGGDLYAGLLSSTNLPEHLLRMVQGEMSTAGGQYHDGRGPGYPGGHSGFGGGAANDTCKLEEDNGSLRAISKFLLQEREHLIRKVDSLNPSKL